MPICGDQPVFTPVNIDFSEVILIMSNKPLDPVVHQFIEDAGKMTQSLGVGRVLGQIFAYLYFSQDPISLSDMQGSLGISKGSASMGVRQLEKWGAVKKIWVKGDRKDYYVANDWFGRILKNAVMDMLSEKMESYASSLENAKSSLDNVPDGNGREEFIRDRLEHLGEFHKRVRALLKNPLLQALFK